MKRKSLFFIVLFFTLNLSHAQDRFDTAEQATETVDVSTQIEAEVDERATDTPRDSPTDSLVPSNSPEEERETLDATTSTPTYTPSFPQPSVESCFRQTFPVNEYWKCTSIVFDFCCEYKRIWKYPLADSRAFQQILYCLEDVPWPNHCHVIRHRYPKYCCTDGPIFPRPMN